VDRTNRCMGYTVEWDYSLEFDRAGKHTKLPIYVSMALTVRHLRPLMHSISLMILVVRISRPSSYCSGHGYATSHLPSS
jgi:hypothetical protein